MEVPKFRTICGQCRPALQGRQMKRLNVSRVATAIVVHLVAMTAPFVYSWWGLMFFVLSTFVILQFGLTLGYHRLLSHRSYQTHPVVRRIFATLGCLSAQAGPISWAATHRFHHRHADGDQDPHSPKQGLAWAHMIWVFYHHPELRKASFILAGDLSSDPFLCFLERHRSCVNGVFALGVFGLGIIIIDGWVGGVSLLVWGVCLRVVVLWHLTFLVNSAAHTWGYRNYRTPDQSRNLWWLALLLLGDGWHNNHHADPRAAAHGHRWFELDITYAMIAIMAKLGLVWSVRPVSRQMIGRSW